MRTKRQAMDGFRWSLQAQGLAAKTIRNYTVQAAQWVAWCEAEELNYLQASREDMLVYFGQIARTHQPTTIKLRHISMRLFYDYLIGEGLAEVNHARSIDTRTVEARPVVPFTQDELRRMYMACRDYREQAIFLLLLGGGLRRDEVFKITRADVNEEAATITILGKGSQYRLISPGAPVLQALHAALAFEDRLCPREDDDYVWRAVRRLAERAGVKGRVYPHRFRHCFATSFLDAGGTVEELQQILGHADIGMSLHYSKAGRSRRALEAHNRINLTERLLGPIETRPIAIEVAG